MKPHPAPLGGRREQQTIRDSAPHRARAAAALGDAEAQCRMARAPNLISQPDSGGRGVARWRYKDGVLSGPRP